MDEREDAVPIFTYGTPLDTDGWPYFAALMALGLVSEWLKTRRKIS